MFRDEKLEMKVGLFIGIGIFLMFFIVFSISDFTVFEKGYRIDVIFSYVNGITESAPVRLAGVHVGEIQEIEIYFDEDEGKTRVRLNAWVSKDVRIEKDSAARINTLGLLGEQYLEISPGISDTFLEEGDTIIGKDPVNVGRQMEAMSSFVQGAADILYKLESGQGTMGKLLTDDTLYNDITNVFGPLSRGEGTIGRLIQEDGLYRDLETVFGRLSAGEGTIGKLLVDETVYYNVEELTTDVKEHPWKLLRRDVSRKKEKDGQRSRGSIIQPR
jgi:phospholipid/cholesterol/gamma-HCH transport system substrate-binding protein